MPELPEIEVLRRSLAPVLIGETIERAEVLFDHLREPVPVRRLARELRSARVSGVGRRAKYLLIELEGGATLVIHLGMSGRLTLVPGDAPPEPHEHVRFWLRSGKRLRFRDPRRFGLVLLLPTERLYEDRHFRHLGMEPLGEGERPDLNGRQLDLVRAGCRGPVKTFLMDARRVVGVGNIYACEALHRAGIHPDRSIARISRARLDRLAAAVVEVLGDAIAQGGTTLNDFANGIGDEGYFQVSLSVYGKEGESCQRCGGTIRRKVHANRSTFYCPSCQR